MQLVLEYKNIKKDDLNLLKSAENTISELGIDINKKYNEDNGSRYWLFAQDDPNVNMYFVVSDDDIGNHENSEFMEEVLNTINEIKEQNEYILNKIQDEPIKAIEEYKKDLDSIKDELHLSDLLNDNESNLYKYLSEEGFEDDDSEDDDEEERRYELLDRIKTAKEDDALNKPEIILNIILDYLEDDELNELLNE